MGRRALAIALLAAGVARAETPEETNLARAHFETGLTYYGVGRFKESIREFLEAYRLSSRTDFLYNIGRCYERLDDPGRATAAYTRYLALRANPPERDEIERVLHLLAPRVATVRVATKLAGAEILVDGDLQGNAPLDLLSLTAGRHRFEARHANFLAEQKVVDLAGGSTVEVAIEPRPVDVGGRARRRWVAPVVGVAAALVVVAVVVAAVVAVEASHDFAAVGQSQCAMQPGCALVAFR